MIWDDLRYVLETARSNSLSRASERLKVNHSTVLRRIRAFEKEVGAELFERDKRGYRLNSHGRELISEIERIEQSILALERKLRGQSDLHAGPLKLSVSDVVFNGILAGKLQRFAHEYPGIMVEVIQDYRSVSLSRSEADVVIRTTSRPPEHLFGRRLSGFAWAIYDSIEPGEESDVLRPWVGLDASLSHLMQARWQRNHPSPRDIVLTVNSVPGVLEAVKAGIGCAPLPCFLGDATAGLHRVGEPIPELESELWLLMHRELRSNAAVQAFSTFIFNAIKQDRDLLEGRRVNSPEP